MRQLHDHPMRTLAALLVTAFVLFMLSGIPALREAQGWTVADALGYVCWFGFLLSGLLFVLAGVYTLIRAAMTHRTA